ncbi:hypothetical protein BcepIL02_gp33 [Burkholderia phage BcepIL02]|uniref:Uncharacterized protein n=1 Tax=Burkholderia phage BcepIL02 TaxID=2886898 RepID=C5IHM5_9CAUD|nr:hypothetical protein BcepIL02_gp33 [Burkholderia phage BcepIL02]ACR15026.1 hypothetical protein BcepIL02_gp33 [Burkholderia phage BcepIL02]
MALTPKKREALKLARELIESGEEGYVCLALKSVARSRPDLRASVASLRRYIMRKLRPYAFLGGWQRKQGIWRYDEQQRADRLAWIDWMLDEPKEA